jgi:hypothetical protein
MDDDESINKKIGQERFDAVKSLARDIFEVPYTVLYIGAKKDRWDLVPEMHQCGCLITVIEVFHKNAVELRKSEYFENVIHGDVRYIEYLDLGREKFDVVVWWHGPEHIQKSESKEIIAKLEKLANRYVILGTPWGLVKQGISGKNFYEVHLSFWDPGDYIRMKYDCLILGKKNEMGSCLVARKVLV